MICLAASPAALARTLLQDGSVVPLEEDSPGIMPEPVPEDLAGADTTGAPEAGTVADDGADDFALDAPVTDGDTAVAPDDFGLAAPEAPTTEDSAAPEAPSAGARGFAAPADDSDCTSEFGLYDGDTRRVRRKSGISAKEKCGQKRRDNRRPRRD